MSGRSGTATCALGANPSAIKRGRRLPYCLLLIALLFGAAILPRDGGGGFPTAQPRSNAQWAHLYAALPLSFEANQGQTDPRVSFLSRGRGYALFLTGREAVLTLKNPSSAAGGQQPMPASAALRLQLLGANDHAVVTGRDGLAGKANYFIGSDPNKWRRNVPTYAKVRYESVYPGVDLVYYGTQGGELEYDFVVAPGADPQAITLGVEAQGHAPLRLNSEGDLVVPLTTGDVHFHKPVVYQTELASLPPTTAGGRRTVVEGHYSLDGQNRVRFELGPYDHNRLLVIDPVLVYATYVGGSGGDSGNAIAVDSNFDAYIAGYTNSAEFPTTATTPNKPYQASSAGGTDAFVTKINSAGTALIYSTYIGGSGTDVATALALSNGSIYLTGYTSSTNFPLLAPVSTAVPFQQVYGGGSTDAFVTELGTTGSSLVYSTYLGGNGADVGQGIAVDANGNAYVTGSTQSPNFPVLSPLQGTLDGSEDAFITEVNYTGEGLVYSTYLGGSGADLGQSIQVDSSGNAYVAGYTFSADFLTNNVPVATPIQGTFGGGTGADAFVAELGSGGSPLVFSTYLGGSGDDRAYGLALDGASNNIYVVGTTTSNNASGSTPFPTTTGAYQPELKGSSNAFVSKINAGGTQLGYSTYLGGSGADQGFAIAVIPNGSANAGNAFVTGLTNSSDFPTLNPLEAILGLSNNTLCGSAPCPDAFVTQLNAQGTGLIYSTYLGGNGYDSGQAIAVDGTGDPYITGTTASTNFPVVSIANSVSYTPPYKSTLISTAGNPFIAKIDIANEPNLAILPPTVNFGNETISVTSALQQITLVNPSSAPLDITNIEITPVVNSVTVFTETDNCLGTINPGGGFCFLNVAFTPNATGNVSTPITITDNAGNVAGTEQTITLSGAGITAATSAVVSPTSLSFPSQDVSTVSAPQNVTITNTGTQTLNITGISTGTTGDFQWTSPSCLALQNTLAVNQSCTINVTFSPVASGTRTASLSISDTATGSPQVVALTGIGAADFTLSLPSSPKTVNPVLIGSDQTTFLIEANGPAAGSNFNGTISLGCSANTTCAFTPAALNVGTTTLLTVSNLTTTLSNPYTFTVTGTSGSQSTTLPINLLFEDFTLTPSPSNDTIQAGQNATYSIIGNPLYGFNQQILLACTQTTLPPNALCSFTPPEPTLNGTSPTSVTLSISTQKYVEPVPVHALPRFPGGKLPPLIFGLLCLAALASLALGNRRLARRGWFGSGWLRVRLATLSLILVLDLALVACRGNTLVVTGTVSGNYTVQIYGTLASNTAVIRYTTFSLSVTPTPP